MKPKLSPKEKETLVKACVSMLQRADQYNQKLSGNPFCGSSGCIYAFIGAHLSPQYKYTLKFEINKYPGLHWEDDRIWLRRNSWDSGQWPNEWANLLEIASTPLERAVVAVGRVRHWMRTGE